MQGWSRASKCYSVPRNLAVVPPGRKPLDNDKIAILFCNCRQGFNGIISTYVLRCITPEASKQRSSSTPISLFQLSPRRPRPPWAPLVTRLGMRGLVCCMGLPSLASGSGDSLSPCSCAAGPRSAGCGTLDSFSRRQCASVPSLDIQLAKGLFSRTTPAEVTPPMRSLRGVIWRDAWIGMESICRCMSWLPLRYARTTNAALWHGNGLPTRKGLADPCVGRSMPWQCRACLPPRGSHPCRPDLR